MKKNIEVVEAAHDEKKVTIEFIRDFDGHASGEKLETTESNALYFLEWEAARIA